MGIEHSIHMKEGNTRSGFLWNIIFLLCGIIIKGIYDSYGFLWAIGIASPYGPLLFP